MQCSNLFMPALQLFQYKKLSYRREISVTCCQLKYWPTVVQITQTDRVSAWGALSATAALFHYLQRVLYTHHSTIAEWACDAVCVINIPRTATLLMSTGLYLWWTKVNYHQCCWWHRVFLHQRTIMDANDCGGNSSSLAMNYRWGQLWRFVTSKTTSTCLGI